VTGASAVASALSGAGAETDTDYLLFLSQVAGLNRDPEIFDAASSLLVDATATVPARVTALLVLGWQLDESLGVDLRIPWADLSTTAVGDNCPFTSAWPAYYNSRRQLPADSLQRFADAVDHVRRDSTENPVLRDLAQCARDRFRHIVPVTVDPALLRLTYVCGDRFRVENLSDEPVTVVFRVDETNDEGGFGVMPGANRVFTTFNAGTLRLFYRRHQIATVHNGGTTCPH
jgi:hypothetical protein